MINPQTLINNLNSTFKNAFDLHPFKFVNISYNFFVLEGTSYAVNRRKNNPLEVKVLPWFNDFWLYSEINFNEKTAISISIFKGKPEDTEKHQLFRAEWDDYNREDENHAQPHWHIVTDTTIAENYKKLMEDEPQGFELFEMSKEEVFERFEVGKIHFAMNGNWYKSESHIHKIDSEEKIVKWLQGLLEHIRIELEYSIV
jgi:hypothetical protein